MSEILITPTAAQKAIEAAEEAREKRDQSIANMRRTDPKYWTYDRLAKHWHLTRARIQKILEKEGVT